MLAILDKKSVNESVLVTDGSKRFHSVMASGKKEYLKASLLQEYSVKVCACFCLVCRDSEGWMNLNASIL